MNSYFVLQVIGVHT